MPLNPSINQSTLSSTLRTFGNSTIDELNTELQHVSTWLKVNKLLLNIEKTKYMIFRSHNKIIHPLNIKFDGKNIECLSNFNLLGININEKLDWSRHVDMISSKISKTICILNKIKHSLPQNIRLMIYNTLIASHFNYGILMWGY